MSALFIIILILFVIINIMIGFKLSKAKTKVDDLMYTSLTSFMFLIVSLIYKVLEFVLRIETVSIAYLDLLILMVICIMFVIINGFVLISKATYMNSKSRCIFGFLVILFFPIHMILSFPILTVITIFKIKEYNNHVIKVYEEEFFDIDINE